LNLQVAVRRPDISGAVETNRAVDGVERAAGNGLAQLRVVEPDLRDGLCRISADMYELTLSR
jgi:hypothetical protein